AERIILCSRPGGIVVGGDDEPFCGIDHLRHLFKRKDLGRQSLTKLLLAKRKPIVPAASVADKVGRPAVALARLEIFAKRNLSRSEVCDVAACGGYGHIDVSAVEILNRLLKIFDRAGMIHFDDRFEFKRRPERRTL